MSTIKRVAWVDLGNVLTTETNSLGNGSYSALGTEYDNTSGLYLYGILVVILASLTPTTGAYLQAFMHEAVDGTNYEDAAGSSNPAWGLALPSNSVLVSTSAKRIALGKEPGLPGFALPASKIKFALLNGTGVSFAASGSSMKLYGAYDQIV
jgi:hypothetical protein